MLYKPSNPIFWVNKDLLLVDSQIESLSYIALAILVMIPISGGLPTSNAHENCIDIDCLKDKLRLICETDPKPEYLDCENILDVWIKENKK